MCDTLTFNATAAAAAATAVAADITTNIVTVKYCW